MLVLNQVFGFLGVLVPELGTYVTNVFSSVAMTSSVQGTFYFRSKVKFPLQQYDLSCYLDEENDRCPYKMCEVCGCLNIVVLVLLTECVRHSVLLTLGIPILFPCIAIVYL